MAEMLDAAQLIVFNGEDLPKPKRWAPWKGAEGNVAAFLEHLSVCSFCRERVDAARKSMEPRDG